uniref:LanC-like protein 3 homolog n=1 Tax=Culicoides sonorensis TaxID=179676 RepID=A0A336MBR5_CULSO
MNNDRYFKNPFEDYKEGDAAYLEKNEDKIIDLIRNYVEIILDKTHPLKNGGSNRRGDLYVGDAGIAYMLIKIHQNLKNLLSIPALEYAKVYVESAKENLSTYPDKSCAFLSGNAGIYAVSAVINNLSDNQSGVQADIKSYLKGLSVCTKPSFGGTDSTGDEFLVGRAGYLAGIYYMNQNINPIQIKNSVIVEICTMIINKGRIYAEEQELDIPIMYQYHGREYLGAAHGLCSILWAFLESPWYAWKSEDGIYPNISITKYNDIKETIDYLLEIQDPEGGFPSKLNSFDKKLIHWCHGAPGNPFEDYKEGDAAYLEKNEDKIIDLIRNYVEIILDKTHPLKNGGSNRRGDLYVGDAGIAYMLIKIHQNLKNLLSIPALEYAKVYVESAKENLSTYPDKSCAFLSGNAGIYAVSAVINNLSDNQSGVQADIKSYLKGLSVCTKPSFGGTDSTGDEFLVGRAGYLAGIYYMNQNINPIQIKNSIIVEICTMMINKGRMYAEEQELDIPIMYQYHDREYLGAAHGLCSILWAFLESPWYAWKSEDGIYPNISITKYNDIKETIDYLLEIQDPEGGFPSKLNSFDKKLIHWCHGAPGVIYLLAKAYLIFNEEKYLDGCKKCAENIWNKGLLFKGPGICHGIAGNGYAFLMMFRLTRNQKYLYRAHKFMEFLTNDHFKKNARIPDRPYSLYEGLAGTVCFLIDLLNPEKAMFPFMDVFETKFEA